MSRAASLLIVLFLSLPLTAFADSAELLKRGFVDMSKVDSTIQYDMRYATANNFTGKVVYDKPQCWLRKDVAEKARMVQRDLKPLGIGLKIWDCYRPFSAQQKFWELVPDERYVAKPKKENGKIVIGSRHNRGAAVDLTLVDLKTGKELPMPTGFDDFSEKASRSYKGNTPQAQRNYELLEAIMYRYGFTGYPTEWWHYDAPDWERYQMLDVDF